VARVADLDEAIQSWTQQRTVENALQVLQAAQVPVSRIYTAHDIAHDPHYIARDMIQSLTTADGLTVAVPGIIPKLSRTPGTIVRRAPTLGENQEKLFQITKKG
jgi:formyl-CoA transferase